MSITTPAETLTHGSTKHDTTVPKNVVTGNYTGNGTQNRAIAHGLGRIPKVIMVAAYEAGVNSIRTYWWNPSQSEIIMINENGVTLDMSTSFTAPDATNFYVGDAINFYANVNAKAVKWWAIG